MDADTSGRLRSFREFAMEKSHFSTNVDCFKIVAFHDVGEIVDARRVCVHRAGGDEAAGLAAYARIQDDWMARREAFEDLWHHGRRLVYGAVNAGGMGTPFGIWCLVADPEQPAANALGVFPDNTARRYAETSGVADGSRAAGEVTAWADRAELAVVERGAEAVASADEEWPDVVCGDDRYLEVARAGPWPVAACGEVRMRAELRARLDELWAQEETGELLPVDEANEVAAYRVVDAWRKAHATTVTEIQ
ncbi:MAG: hypothetical protein ACRD12_04165 [Acidimicrobiales bacterium]